MKNRDFKGIWIPKEIWLSKDLSVNEKIMLLEIDSLDNEKGCFASNEYFADFMGLKKPTISKIITSLLKKGYLTREIKYKKGSKEVEKRVLKIIRGVPYKIQGGIVRMETPSPIKVKDINNNNINNNNKKEHLKNAHSLFEEIWELYNFKKDKKKSKDKFLSLMKNSKKPYELFQKIKEAIPLYLDELKKDNKREKWRKQQRLVFWLNAERWEDDYSVTAQKKVHKF